STPKDRRSGLLSIALLGLAAADDENKIRAPAADESWFGIQLDEWVELIPNTTELTGLAFHYDDPGAEAAQAILIAVPPTTTAKTWDCDTLVDILNETYELAQIRGVDWRLLGKLGQLLPAMYLAQNVNNDTIAVRLGGALMGERVIRAANLSE